MQLLPGQPRPVPPGGGRKGGGKARPVHWKGGGKSKKKGRLSQVAQEQQAAEKAHEERICCPVRRLHPGTTWPPRGQAPPAGPTSSAARLSGPARARLAGSASTGALGRHRRGQRQLPPRSTRRPRHSWVRPPLQCAAVARAEPGRAVAQRSSCRRTSPSSGRPGSARSAMPSWSSSASVASAATPPTCWHAPGSDGCGWWTSTT